jgi:hypothetical protein
MGTEDQGPADEPAEEPNAPMREEMLQNAVTFLSHSQARPQHSSASLRLPQPARGRGRPRCAWGGGERRRSWVAAGRRSRAGAARAARFRSANSPREGVGRGLAHATVKRRQVSPHMRTEPSTGHALGFNRCSGERSAPERRSTTPTLHPAVLNATTDITHGSWWQ